MMTRDALEAAFMAESLASALPGLQPALDTAAAAHATKVAAALSRISVRLPGVDLAEVLEGIGDSLRPRDPHPLSSLTENELDELKEAGVPVDASPLPLTERPSFKTAVRAQQILSDALSTSAVADKLGVSPGRVRQRYADGTLHGIKTTRGLVFPAYQFTDRGELHGWAAVRAAIPSTAAPVEVDSFLATVSPDLTVSGQPVTAREWLAGGGDPKAVADLARDAFRP
jgi:hypothetical protein